jgi:hypothetical protein
VRCSLLLTIVPCACPLRADHRPVYVHRPACPARASTEDTTTPSDEAESVGGTVGARDRPSAGACCWIAEHGTPRRPVRFALARRTVPVCRATSCLPVSSDHRRMCVHACTFSLSPVARHFFYFTRCQKRGTAAPADARRAAPSALPRQMLSARLHRRHRNDQ